MPAGPRVAIVMPDDFSLWQPRRGLFKTYKEEGIDVVAISGPGEYSARLQELGVRHIPISVDRFVSPLSDVRTFRELTVLFRRERFDVVHAFTTKINVLAALAARRADVPHVVISIDGAGYAFEDVAGWRRTLLRRAVTAMYRRAFRAADRIRFLQEHDLKDFRRMGIFEPGRDEAVVIPGEGVDLDEYLGEAVDGTRLRELRSRLAGDRPCDRFVVMLARAIWTKGVREFIEAAELLHEQFPDTRFVLAGLHGEGPDAVPPDWLHERRSQAFEWLGFWPDLREVIALADLVVLPSYAREGMPSTLIEAMAMGRPLVATDNVGCRDLVTDGVNGMLVHPRSSPDLARAIGAILGDRKLRDKLAAGSLERAREEFDERRIYRRFLTELYGLRQDAATGRWMMGKATGASPVPGG